MTNSELFCAICNDTQNNQKVGTPVLCTCGWKDRIVEKEISRERDFKNSVKMCFSAAAVFILSIYVIKWGSESFVVPYYRIGQVTGMLSANGYIELAQTCLRARQWACAENAYLQSHNISKNPEPLYELAILQLRQKNLDGAIENFEAYVKNNGTNVQAYVEFAALLEGKHRLEEALKTYRKAIELTPADKLPVQPTIGLVRLEIRLERYTRALNRILQFHDLAPNAKGYMNTELEQVRTILKNRSKLARR